MRLEFATLVGSRICHDLISPIGAIGNGVELLGLTNDTIGHSPEMDLISQSVENANARIRFFRIAFGSPSSKRTIGSQEVLSVLAASALGGRFNYFWQITGDQSRSDVQTAFLLLQCFETAMPLGGDIHIHLDGDKWELKAQGPRVSIAQPLWNSLTDPQIVIDHTPAQVQFALLPAIVADAGKVLDIQIAVDSITVQF